MSIWAPAWVPFPKLSWIAAFWICGANPKWTARFRPASLPRASNVANAGSRPVRILLFAGPLLLIFVNDQKTFTFPENWNAQPLDICIVRPCALAVAATPSAKPNNNSVRRFIRESLLGSVPAKAYRSCPRGAPAPHPRAPPPPPPAARYSRVGRCSHQYSSGFSPTVVTERKKPAPTSLRASRCRTLPAPARLGFPRRSDHQGRRPERARDLQPNPHPGRPMARNPAKY